MMPDSLHSAILSNGEIDIGEINLSDMDPEDIRVSVLIFDVSFFSIVTKLMKNKIIHSRLNYVEYIHSFRYLKINQYEKIIHILVNVVVAVNHIVVFHYNHSIININMIKK